MMRILKTMVVCVAAAVLCAAGVVVSAGSTTPPYATLSPAPTFPRVLRSGGRQRWKSAMKEN